MCNVQYSVHLKTQRKSNLDILLSGAQHIHSHVHAHLQYTCTHMLVQMHLASTSHIYIHVHMHIHIHVPMHIQVDTHLHAHVHIQSTRTHTRTRRRTSTHAHAHTQTQTHARTGRRTSTHAHAQTQTHARTRRRASTHAHAHIYIERYASAPDQLAQALLLAASGDMVAKQDAIPNYTYSVQCMKYWISQTWIRYVLLSCAWNDIYIYTYTFANMLYSTLLYSTVPSYAYSVQ